MPNSNVIDKAGDLHTRWRLAQAAERKAHAEFVAYVERHGLRERYEHLREKG